MSQKRQIIAIAGVGGLGQYICQELSADGRFTVIVLTRQGNLPLTFRNTTIHKTDYTEPSLIGIFNATGATTLISTLNCPNDDYLPLHTSLLSACLNSITCKRFIPSEWGGNIDDFPNLPRAYGRTRAPFRDILQQTKADASDTGNKIEYTLINHGWCMEYFLPEGKSYRKHCPGEFPVDVNKWEYVVRGTGEEKQAWTCGRDVARGVKELLLVDEWPPARPLTRVHRPLAEINASLQKYKDQPNSIELAIAEAEEWGVSGATACPKEKALRQQACYFSRLKFMTIEDMLNKAETEGFV
ncbi:hypothetical protein PHISCL_00693 [Aspergillus sclerotialis]|uniref:Uncharacterized protein n=1 Tax=Aspergillus sclerotialis TaxID=2070753 RepID=A0A3A2ZV23_9EURO|nr:hypothetical protein PHISCL_00693 [Aspergillus sclerotialis]